jgi:hypothetical protein
MGDNVINVTWSSEGNEETDSWTELFSDEAQVEIGLLLFLCLLAILWIVSVTVNVSLLTVILKKPTLHTTSNRFIMNLLVVNVFSCCLLLPLVALDQLHNTEYGEEQYSVQCILSQTTTQAMAALSLLSVLLVGVDQYLAVLRPLRYHQHMTKAASSALITTVWMISSLSSLSTALLPIPTALLSCCPSATTPTALLPFISALATTLFTFFLPVTTLGLIYFKIYTEAHNSSERERRCSMNPVISENIYNIASTAMGPIGVCRADLLSVRRMSSR